ncbi:HisA/HisF-related TIM barrel protein [Agrococcus sediminis]|uniref:oxidoreductase n=1 Tax=Agrococcus sediminis TaxID=2599924 RepID=UPI0038282036
MRSEEPGGSRPNGLHARLRLPNGQLLGNRVAKAAMEENLADERLAPSGDHRTLYREWSMGGAGLILTGNVMVAADHVTSPHGLVLDEHQPIEPFIEWAAAARTAGSQVWMQINHTGRQVKSDLGLVPLAPSAVAVRTAQHEWPTPRAMTDRDIGVAVEQFATTARLAVDAGFTGVQIHGAHGYLLSQFLSPLANRRDDEWGGDLAARSRLLLQVVEAVRSAVPSSAAVGLKLNTADFQRGGFDANDAVRLITVLNDHPIDLLELSGGTVESPAMNGAAMPGSSRARQAYFLELIDDLRAHARMPLMLTGGIRSREVAEEALRRGIDVVGIGTALALVPDLPARWLDAEHVVETWTPSEGMPSWQISAARQAIVRQRLRGLARQLPDAHGVPVESMMAAEAARRQGRVDSYRAWLESRLR